MDKGAMIVTNLAWLVVGVVLVLDMTGLWRRYFGFRWIGAGLLLMVSSMIFSEVADDRNWPISELKTIDVVMMLILVPAAALGLNGYRLYWKSRRETAASGTKL